MSNLAGLLHTIPLPSLLIFLIIPQSRAIIPESSLPPALGSPNKALFLFLSIPGNRDFHLS